MLRTGPRRPGRIEWLPPMPPTPKARQRGDPPAELADGPEEKQTSPHTLGALPAAAKEGRGGAVERRDREAGEGVGGGAGLGNQGRTGRRMVEAVWAVAGLGNQGRTGRSRQNGRKGRGDPSGLH